MHFDLDLPLFRGEGNVLFAQSPCLDFAFCDDLIGGEEALLAIEEDGLAVGEVGLVQEGVRADAVQEGACPSGAAVHTVGILDAAAHVGLDAAQTRLFVTAITLDLLANNGGVGIGANGTHSDFDGLGLLRRLDDDLVLGRLAFQDKFLLWWFGHGVDDSSDGAGFKF